MTGLMDFDVEIDIPGEFSVYNSLTAIAVCRHFNVPIEKIKDALKVAKVKGRIEMVKVSDDFTFMIMRIMLWHWKACYIHFVITIRDVL